MKTFQVTSRFIADTEHGVTNKITDFITAETEEEAKELHREELSIRFQDNLWYGGVIKQDIEFQTSSIPQ